LAPGCSAGQKETWLISFTLTFWESREAIRAFAGDNIELARYYPEDKRYLLEFEPGVLHYEVFTK